MYYVKSEIGSGEITIEINDENVFTRCVECGKEIAIDIVQEIKSNPDFDLYGTGRFCNQKCADENVPPWKVEDKSTVKEESN